MFCCVFSVDGRDRDFSLAERWSDENVFANRAYFMPEKKPAELGVDHIRETDQGVYRCRVDFKIAQTRNSKVNLTVIGKCQKRQEHVTQTPNRNVKRSRNEINTPETYFYMLISKHMT